MRKIKAAIAGVALALFMLVPLASPANATHNCGFEPCPHPDDVITLLCQKSALVNKLGLCP
jgi:hypothetical protein